MYLNPLPFETFQEIKALSYFPEDITRTGLRPQDFTYLKHIPEDSHHWIQDD